MTYGYEAISYSNGKWLFNGRAFKTKKEALETEESERLPDADNKATVGIVDLAQDSQEFIPIAETFAWNWHVGSRQQWLGDDRIIYNDTRDGQHVCL